MPSTFSNHDVQHLVDLIAPMFPETAEGRRAVLLAALGFHAPILEQIDFTSETPAFVSSLINSLYAFDTPESGRSALWSLAKYAAKVRGAFHNTDLLALQTMLNPAPAAAVNEGHVFISYSHKNRPFVNKLISDLRRHNFPVWIDKDALKAGTRDWENAIRQALQSARAFILIASPMAQESLRVRDEIAIADDLRVPLFPLWVQGTRWHDCVPLGMGSIQYIDARTDDDYPDALAKLIAALSEILSVPRLPQPAMVQREVIPLRNPYKGLHAFTEADSADFYGREGLVNGLIAALNKYPHFLALLGASGSGKSSVIQAGLLTKLKAEAGSKSWRYLPPFTPTKRPITALANALLSALPGVLITAVVDCLDRKSFDGLALLAQQIAPKDGRVVLYIDQFEEVFTLASEDECERFINLLTTAANDPDCPLTILLSMRADFYDRPPRYPELGELMEAHHLQIYPLTLAELYDVVQKPAEAVGLTFEDALVTELVYDVRDQAGPLPLLQFALDQLYIDCVEKAGGRKLTRAAYREMGGVRGALTRHADTIYRGLDAELKPFAPELFKRLINVGETEQETTRRHANRSDLTLPNANDTAKLARVAETFVRERLLTADRAADGEETYEVAHEALLREWESLRDWLREARRDIRRGRTIEIAAEEWRASGMNPQYLYRDEQLAEALRWRDRNMPNAQEAAFIEAGVAAQREREAAAAREQAERLRLAEEKAAAEEWARLAEGARATRFRNAARFAGVLLVIAVSLLAVAGVTTVNTNAALATVEFEATVSVLRSENDLAFLHQHGVLPAQAIHLTPVPGTAIPPTVIAVATRWANRLNMAWTPLERDFDGVPMVYVPQGCYFMGSGHGNANELPVNEVCLDAFWIDKYEVWQEQFNDNGGQQAERPYFRGEMRPVENISWIEARNYCALRDARLPTESEWEYAARGWDNWVYPWGNQFPDEPEDFAVFDQSRTAFVGTDRRNAGASWVGALDMSGNVWEWVSTSYAAYPYRADDGREDIENASTERVLRGGSWSGDFPDTMRASYRNRGFQNRRDFYYGFRCARST